MSFFFRLAKYAEQKTVKQEAKLIVPEESIIHIKLVKDNVQSVTIYLVLLRLPAQY